jgi:hypothetical protein
MFVWFERLQGFPQLKETGFNPLPNHNFLFLRFFQFFWFGISPPKKALPGIDLILSLLSYCYSFFLSRWVILGHTCYFEPRLLETFLLLVGSGLDSIQIQGFFFSPFYFYF